MPVPTSVMDIPQNEEVYWQNLTSNTMVGRDHKLNVAVGGWLTYTVPECALQLAALINILVRGRSPPIHARVRDSNPPPDD